MLQYVEGTLVETVEFDTLPETPITGLTEAEAVYETALSRARGYVNPIYDPNYPTAGKYAAALTDALDNGVITEPGKYGIHFPTKPYGTYVIYRIEE